MQAWASLVEKTVNLNDSGTRTAVQVWFRPEVRCNGVVVWSSDALVRDGLVARSLAHEVLASGLLSVKVAA